MSYLRELIKDSDKTVKIKTRYKKVIRTIIKDILEDKSKTAVYYEDNRIIIGIPFDVIPASRHRTGKFGNYIDEPYNTFKKVFTDFFRVRVLPLVNEDFLDHPIKLYFKLDYKLPNSASKKKKANLIHKYKCSKPDIDNIEKSIMDSIYQSGITSDDSYIADTSKSKVWCHSFHTVIIIEKIIYWWYVINLLLIIKKVKLSLPNKILSYSYILY